MPNTTDNGAQVLVIGGGMAGVLCLRQLRDRGVDCVLAGGNRIGMGITKGTTAVLSAQHDVLYSDLIRRRGADQAKRYLEANLRAVEGFRELSRTIPCDFQDMPSVMSLMCASRYGVMALPWMCSAFACATALSMMPFM